MKHKQQNYANLMTKPSLTATLEFDFVNMVIDILSSLPSPFTLHIRTTMFHYQHQIVLVVVSNNLQILFSDLSINT